MCTIESQIEEYKIKEQSLTPSIDSGSLIALQTENQQHQVFFVLFLDIGIIETESGSH